MTTAAKVCMLVDLPFEVIGEIMRDWLELRSLVRVDSAVCNHQARLVLLKLFSCDICTQERIVNVNTESCAQWFSKRKVHLTRVSLSVASQEISKCLRLHSKSIWYARCTDQATIDLVALNCRNLKSFLCDKLTVTPNLNAVLGFGTNLQELRLEEVQDLQVSHFEEVFLPNLRFLSLFGTDCDDTLLSAILRATEGLQHLNIGDCGNITDVGLVAMAKHCLHLRSIGLNKLQISDGALAEFTELCSCIENVKIYENELITDAGVLSITRNLTKLRNIKLSLCDALTDRSLEHLAKFNVTTLETLCACGIEQVRVDVLVRLLQQCQQLRTLVLDCDINPYYAEVVPHMSNLQSLSLYSTLSDDCLCMIARHCQQLQKFGIPCAFKVDNDLVTAAHQSALEAGVSDVRVMHCADVEASENDVIYTEKAVLAMMDKLPKLKLIWAPEVSGDELNDRVVQRLWQRSRPGLRFERDEKKFFLEVLGDITVL